MRTALKCLVWNFLLPVAIIGGFPLHVFAGDVTEETTIEILQRASVSGPRIYLSDVAKCGGSKTHCREISGIDVAPSPSPGRSAFIQRSQILGIIQKEWPGAEVTFLGAESVRVEAASVELAADDVRVKLQSEINERVRAVKDQVKVQIQRIQSPSLLVRPSQSAIDFPDLAGIAFDDPNWVARNLVGNRPIGLTVYNPSDSDDKLSIQLQVTFSVELNLPVTKKFIRSGQIIGESQVSKSWVSVRRGIGDFAQTMDAIIGKKSKQNISPGDPVFTRYLESPMAVGRNQVVKMIVRKGDLEIAAKATTIDQGAVGETVQVVNMANKMRMRAKVIDEKTVEAVSF